MNAAQILDLMKAYFAGKQPPEALENFAALTPRAILKESLDVVDFIVYLEEELEREIDITALSGALMNSNFGDLAAQVEETLAEG